MTNGDKHDFFNSRPLRPDAWNSPKRVWNLPDFKSPLPASKDDPIPSRTRYCVQEKPLITVKRDQTVIWQERPLILLSDLRINKAPFFGYFPPNSPKPEMVIIDQYIQTIVRAASWKLWADVPSTTFEPALRSFNLKSVEAKGMAMVAARNIKMGELIHKERPISVSAQDYNVAPDQDLTTGDFYRSALSRLGRPQQQAFLSFSNCWEILEQDVMPGKITTNSLPVDLKPASDGAGPTHHGCFATLSKANHSCAPNANYFFHFPDFTGRFYASRDIKRGEEITITYCDLLQTQATRKKALCEAYLFVCRCPFCSTEPPSMATIESDSNRMTIKETIEVLAWASAALFMQPEKLRKAITLAEQEDLVAYKAQLLYLGGVCLMHGEKESDALEGVKCLQRAEVLYAVLEGPDSYHVQEIQQHLQEANSAM